MRDWLRGLDVKTVGAIVVTVFVFVMVLWWLAVVASYVGTAPVLGGDGTVLVDKFANAKDVLLVVLPLATTAAGYWFGNQGVTQAQQQAAQANELAVGAKADADRAKQDLLNVIDASPPGTLDTALRAVTEREARAATLHAVQAPPPGTPVPAPSSPVPPSAD